MLISIILMLLGMFFLLFGFIVWKFKIASVIAGYDPETVSDPDKLATWVGICMMSTGLCAFIIAGLNYLFHSEKSELISLVAFMILSMMSGIAALAGAQKYYK